LLDALPNPVFDWHVHTRGRVYATASACSIPNGADDGDPAI
jgi:hypothetical protein